VGVAPRLYRRNHTCCHGSLSDSQLQHSVLVSAFQLSREDFVAYLRREQRYEFTTATATLVDATVLRQFSAGAPLTALSPQQSPSQSEAQFAAPVQTADECEAAAAAAATSETESGVSFADKSLADVLAATTLPQRVMRVAAAVAAANAANSCYTNAQSLRSQAYCPVTVTGVICVGSTELRYWTEKMASAVHHFDSVSRDIAAPLWQWGSESDRASGLLDTTAPTTTETTGMIGTTGTNAKDGSGNIVSATASTADSCQCRCGSGCRCNFSGHCHPRQTLSSTELRPGKRYLQFCLRASYELAGRWGFANFLHTTRLADGRAVPPPPLPLPLPPLSDEVAAPVTATATETDAGSETLVEAGYCGATTLAQYIAEGREGDYGLKAVKALRFKYM